MADDEGAGAAATMDDDELELMEAEGGVEDESLEFESAAAKKAAERQLAKEQKDIQSKRMAKLQELRDEQAKRMADAAAMGAEKRLEFLMQQAEVFTHFMGPGADKGGTPTKASGAGAGATKNKRGRHAVSEKQEDEELIEEGLAEGNANMKILAQPKNITATLREYQMEGLNWMVNLHDNNISGILADEMGLGKTLQSITLLAYLKEARGVNGPHLVLVPKSVLGNWHREFTKWCPSIKCLKLFGQDKETRLKMIKDDLLGGDWDVVVTTFETVCKERNAFKKIPWYYVVIDEAHRIKNENSVLSQTVRQLDSAYRLLLTGTPLQNNLHELWALLNFLLPDVFSSSESFDNWFKPAAAPAPLGRPTKEAQAAKAAAAAAGAGSSSSSGQGDMEIIKRLHAVIKPFLLRRLKRDVESSLLPKIEMKVYIGLSALQKQWYRNILLKDAGALNSLGGAERVRLLNTLMQLRKVCNHPYLFDGAEPGPPYFDGPHLWENCGKMVLLQKLLPKLKSQGSRILIFCQMTRMLDILEDFCRLSAYDYCRIDGNTDSVDRDSAMDVFNAPNSPKFCFLLSTRAGGLGINLYTADVVILYDSDWNPQMDLQAMDRAHRIGQKKQVRVFRLVTDKTVEEKIVERAERKLFLDAVVIQQGRLAQQEKGLSKGELMAMVKFGADEIVKSGDGGLITDEDVDNILAKSEARSKEASEKLKKELSEQLGAYSLEDLLKSDTSKFLYSADDLVDTGPGAGSGGVVIALPEREKRKVIYDEKEYYRAVMGVEQGTHKGRPPGPRTIKPPPMQDFQFYNRKRIEEIFNKDNDLNLRRRHLQLLLKDAETSERKERSEFVKTRREEMKKPVSEGGLGIATTEEATTKAEDEWLASKGGEEGLQSYKLQAEIDSLALSPEEEDERKELLSQGFSTWAKRDFKTFLAACERHGRNAKDAVVAEVAEVTDKAVGEVGRYFDAFWARHAELADDYKFMDRIEKGEQKIKRRDVMETIIADKVARYPDPYRSLVLPYGPNKMTFMRGYTEEEDRFLICAVNTLGYGCWDALKGEIRRHEGFRFNWFIKSRTPADLARRCDALIRLLEKEAVEEGTAAGKELSQAGGVSRGRGRGRGGVTRGTGRGRGRGRGGMSLGGEAGKRGRASYGAGASTPVDLTGEDMDEDEDDDVEDQDGSDEDEDGPSAKRGRRG